MPTTEIALSLFAAVLLYGYIAYPILLALAGELRQRRNPEWTGTPTVSVIVAAYNEEKSIAARVHNLLGSDYPHEKLEVIVASDGSTDGTVRCVGCIDSKNVTLLDIKERRGRASVHNEAVKIARGEVLVFTDAETEFKKDCILNMVRHYADDKVGCTGGRLISRNFNENALGIGQRWYWRFEYFLRRVQSDLGVLTKTSGAIMSMRTHLVREIPVQVDIDQVAAPWSILAGYKVVHDDAAIGYESFAVDAPRQLKARVRFVVQALEAIQYHRALLNPLKHPVQAVNYFSYRLMRYITPVMLLGIFTASTLLASSSAVYGLIWGIQVAIYASAILGFALEQMRIRVRVLCITQSLVYGEICIFLGLLRYLSGKRVAFYDKDA